MADLPAPVGCTTSASFLARSSWMASSCPGRSDSHPKLLRAVSRISDLAFFRLGMSPVGGTAARLRFASKFTVTARGFSGTGVLRLDTLIGAKIGGQHDGTRPQSKRSEKTGTET